MLVGSGLIAYTLNLHVQNILIYGSPVSPGLHPQCTSTPEWGLCPVAHEASGFIPPEWKRRFCTSSIWHTMSQNQRCSEFYEYGADGHPEETRPSTFLASLLLLKSPRLDFHMKRQSNHRSRNDSPRIVGTYAERIRVLQFTERVWELLPHLHPELNFDHEAFAHITVGFREKGQSSSRLMGFAALQILSVETL